MRCALHCSLRIRIHIRLQWTVIRQMHISRSSYVQFHLSCSSQMPAKRKASAKAPVSRAKVAKKEVDKAPDTAAPAPDSGKRHVIIEASKECGCFKVRSGKLEKVLTAGRPDIVVTVNAEKPRKGCFEVKVDGKVVLSLLGMPRPFTALKALDMEEEGKKILAALG